MADVMDRTNEAAGIRLLLTAGRAQCDLIELTMMRCGNDEARKLGELFGYWLIHRREVHACEQRLAALGVDA